MEGIDMKNYFYDKNNVRYTLVSTNSGEAFNWLFLPGGPGADSSYFSPLTDNLCLPGNTWLIDLPGNGSHDVKKDNFDDWFDIFIPTIQRFKNPVLVGHSFGGMLPLLFPELENILKGFVILNSSPSLWMQAAAEVAKKRNLPDLSTDMVEFTENPNQETFDKALLACMPYYFESKSMKKGEELFKTMVTQYLPAVWWQRKVIDIQYDAKWIPQNIPTLIVGAEFDAITPFDLYQSDERFNRKNISKLFIKEAGHIPWVEKPEELIDALHQFSDQI